MPATRRPVRHPDGRRAVPTRHEPRHPLRRAHRRRRDPGEVAMTDDERDESTPETNLPAAVTPGGATPAPVVASDAAAEATTPAPSQQEMAVRSALENVMDPEIGLSVI